MQDRRQDFMQRRYDLDWLRTLAFGLLILYHGGMMYVSWDWHISSQYQSEALKYLMLLVNQWRLPLLFFISGAALHLALASYKPGQLLKLRSLRLGLPLLLGILVIVPPQLYFEMRQAGEPTGHYLQFWLAYLTPDHPLFENHRTPLFGQMTWNHLWFLPYLWCYSVIALLLAPGLARFSNRGGLRAWLWWPWLGLALVNLTLRDRFPSSHALADDWYNHGQYFLVFVAGYLLAGQLALWQRLAARVWDLLLAALLCYLLLMALFSLPENTGLGAGVELWGDRFIHGLQALNLWLWILALAGLAHRYLNRDSPLRRYCSTAVYPWYVLHQTLTIWAGFYLTQWGLGPVLEPLLLIGATALGCWLGYELIRRVGPLRWLFGLGQRRRADLQPQPMASMPVQASGRL